MFKSFICSGIKNIRSITTLTNPGDILGVINNLLSEEQQTTINATQKLLQKYRPLAQQMFRTADTAATRDIMRDMGQNGLLGVTIPVENVSSFIYLNYIN